jgi:hypothetical protein
MCSVLLIRSGNKAGNSYQVRNLQDLIEDFQKWVLFDAKESIPLKMMHLKSIAYLLTIAG